VKKTVSKCEGVGKILCEKNRSRNGRGQDQDPDLELRSRVQYKMCGPVTGDQQQHLHNTSSSADDFGAPCRNICIYLLTG